VNLTKFQDYSDGPNPVRESVPTTKGKTPGSKILVVEDERELAEILEYNLRLQGFVTLTAEDGLTACRLAGSEKPDLILLDILLPDLDGWEICKLIRGHHLEEIASVPIVMLTALSSTNDRLKGLELGADAYIAKPYSMKEVTATVRNLLTRRQRHQALTLELSRFRRREELLTDIQALLFHELRNQMVVLDGYTELLSKTIADGTRDGDSRTYLEAISRSSGYLNTLAEEFFLISRIESNHLELPCQPADLALVVRKALELCQPLAREKSMHFDFPEPEKLPRVRVNPSAAKLVVVNLCDNAVRYAGSGTTISLSLKGCGTDSVELTIGDQGSGIPEEDLPHLFEKFFRGKNHRDTVRGSGLGLYFVKILMQAMGGSVEVTSAPGRGTKFLLRFGRCESATSMNSSRGG